MRQSESATQRRAFLRNLGRNLRVTWPILSFLTCTEAALGALVGLLEGWGIGTGVYFAFVTGLTIGYGDFAPTMMSTRLIALMIGLLGIIVTGVVAAIAVAALRPPTSP